MLDILEMLIGAVVAWVVPMILDRLLARGRAESSREALEQGFPWVLWCVANAIGGGIGGSLSLVLGLKGLETPGDVANWSATGIAIGVCQWLVLRRYLKIGPFWVVSSALGWSVWAYFKTAQIPEQLGWSAAGLCVGILQWFLLRRVCARAFWWMPANLVGWQVAGPLAFAFGLMLLSAQVTLPIAWVLSWAFLGLVGSIALALALRFMPARERHAAT